MSHRRSTRGFRNGAVAIALVVMQGVALAEPGTQAHPAASQGTAPTQATFVSTNADPWDVVVDGQAVCSTPCSGPIFPLQYVVLRSQEPDPVLLDVGRLGPGDLMVSGKPLENGMYVCGIVATTFGGMAVATGITLSAVGLGKGRDGMTTAGLITGGAGLLTLGGGLYLMMKALPSVTIGHTVPYVSGNAVGIAGTF